MGDRNRIGIDAAFDTTGGVNQDGRVKGPAFRRLGGRAGRVARGSPKRSLWKTGSNFILALTYDLHFPTIT